jgi:hypothetical protein
METATAAPTVGQDVNGLVTPDELPALFARFNLDFPAGLAFPFQHKWAPKEGRELERYSMRQSAKAVLVIQPLAQYCDEGGPIDAHAWQLITDGLD